LPPRATAGAVAECCEAAGLRARRMVS
jgi:hypothetical protein